MNWKTGRSTAWRSGDESLQGARCCFCFLAPGSDAGSDVEEVIMSEEEPKTCTTSGRPVDVVRSEQTEPVGQHKDYIVLCPDERAKGFVRPVRNAYRHVGRSVCGEIVNRGDLPLSLQPLGGPRDICARPFGHEGDHDGPFYSDIDQRDHAEILETHRKGGCGSVTTMGSALAETYARDPKFYGATFCVICNRHLPVDEFVWDGTDERVGS